MRHYLWMYQSSSGKIPSLCSAESDFLSLASIQAFCKHLNVIKMTFHSLGQEGNYTGQMSDCGSIALILD